MMATVRNASKPSRKTMMRAGSMVYLLRSCIGRVADHLHAVGSVGLLSFLAAGVADAEDLQVVKRRRELLALADLALAALELFVVELDDARRRWCR